MKKNKAIIAILTVFIVLLIDQILKIWIKTTMIIGEEIPVFDWFRIHFVENKGMAFGMEWGGYYGKLALSLFRILAVIAITYFLISLINKKETSKGLVFSIALILAGALGNIIDSTFYGLLFSDSSHQVAQFLPKEGGYAGLLHGRVVDMLYFPLYQGFLPNWLPFWGGKYTIFFRPVFNIADSAITLGVLSIILFQRSFFTEETTDETAPENKEDTLNVDSSETALLNEEMHTSSDYTGSDYQGREETVETDYNNQNYEYNNNVQTEDNYTDIDNQTVSDAYEGVSTTVFEPEEDSRDTDDFSDIIRDLKKDLSGQKDGIGGDEYGVETKVLNNSEENDYYSSVEESKEEDEDDGFKTEII